MNNEQINTAIAEACGWREVFQGVGPNKHRCLGDRPERDENGNIVAYYEACSVPDYLTDLNAMHGAEKILTADQFEQYRWILWDICKQFRVKDWYRCYLSSTAAQRAEAFLRTLGKWEETQ